MDQHPIVVARRQKDKTLRLVCPHCGWHHSHGSGGEERIHTHRIAHCADTDLPQHKRGKSLGYHIVVLDEVDMNETELRGLFAEMDEIAAAARADPLHVPEDNQIKFRALQKRRHPELDKQQWLDLFAVWRVHDAAKLAAARDAIVQRAHAIARANPGSPFVCVCGEEIDPSDPAMEALHRPHVFVAGLDRVKRISWRVDR
ncbi:hypothetical protein [Bradyrhizobium cenepequi]